MDIESAMVAAPNDAALRRDYFDLLIRFAGVRTGLSYALLPEIGHPLYFRCATTDVINLAQVFRDEIYGFLMRATPLRILDLGGYAGYGAVYLAQRFPRARILCVEPCSNSFNVLTMNTMPNPRIQRVNAAAWHSTGRVGVAARYYGDWGTQLHDQLPDGERNIRAFSVADLLRMANWGQVDMIKCDIEGAERAVFADRRARWLQTLDALAIETHDAITPGSGATVAACFDPVLYERTRHGDVDLYHRHTPFRAVTIAQPREMPLISTEPSLFPIALQDVAQTPWAFFAFDGASCQLHPNEPGQPTARAIFDRTLDGQTRFTTTLHHAGHPASPVTFTVILQHADGREILRASHTLQARTHHAWTIPLPAPTGPHRIILQTELAPDSAHNHAAWARWFEPTVG